MIHFRLRTSQRWIERPPGSCDSLVELPFEPRRHSSQASHNVLGHSMYSNRRFTDQSATGLDAIARRLLVLSAKLISLASLLFFGAVSICLRFRSSFGSVLSSVTTMTISATRFPNSWAIISTGNFLILNSVVQQCCGCIGATCSFGNQTSHLKQVVDVGFLSDSLAALVDMPSCRCVRRSEDYILS